MNGLRFPLFVDLHGKKAVVVGGGHIGGKRAETLAQFGATVTVIDPKPITLDGVTVIQRGYQQGDLAGAYLCLAATHDPVLNRTVATHGKAVGALVNVADDPTLCDFFFPALCQSEDMVVGLVSDGTHHRKTATVAKKIREII